MKYQVRFHENKDPIFSPISLEILDPDLEEATAIINGITNESLYLWYKEAIKKVIKGEIDREIRGDEGYEMNIKKDFTEVYFIYDTNMRCTIETQELYNLIEIWWSEYLKHNTHKLDRILMNSREKDLKELQDEMDEDRRNGTYSDQKYQDKLLELKAKYKMN
jgi:hypothetical protein